MTLSARPKTVEQAEWVAHQGMHSVTLLFCLITFLTAFCVEVVEHYRNLWNFVRVIHEKDEDGSTICNRSTCPRMSAGA